jgi:prolipoprotein diacylglyceryl transferase
MDPLAAISWNMDPELVRLGPLRVRFYGVLFALGFVIGYRIMISIFRREDRPVRDLDQMLIYMILGTIIGARLGHCFFYEPSYYLSHPFEIVKFWQGGLASHGGLIGIVTSLWLYTRRHPDQPPLWLFDRVAIPTALGGTCIRLGNFFNSEIVGDPSDLPWAVIFRRVDDVPRHPAQLYESVSYLVIFVVLYTVYRKSRPVPRPGLLLGLFFTCMFSARFLVEFVKMRQAAYSQDLPLSVGQMLSLPLILAGVALLVRAARSPKPTATAATGAKARS